MMIQAAHQLGHTVTVLDPDPDGPAGQLADAVVVGHYADPQALAELAAQAKVFTTEFENVPADALRLLAQHGLTFPSADCVERAQDRLLEKRFLQSAGVPVAPHHAVVSVDDLLQAPSSLFPGILKTARLGYDGKGQHRVSTIEEATGAFEAMGRVPCVLEQQLPLLKEISVITARDRHGKVVTYPVGENIHRNGILHTTTLPAQIDPTLESAAKEAAQRVVQAMDYVGVLCVEFFVLEGDQLVANEMAPRPHNSGHYSIEACVTSQFEQQVRICTNMPLGPTDLRFPVRMTNILGDAWFAEDDLLQQNPIEPDWQAWVAQGGVVHLYGKREPRRGRKMGHVTQPITV
jgi:5-(carboxyamino)imidazole ribonucleotide synthase